MVNLYQHKNSGIGAEGHVRCGLQSIRQKDVSARSGCINLGFTVLITLGIIERI
jgi:hypothetical protein